MTSTLIRISAQTPATRLTASFAKQEEVESREAQTTALMSQSAFPNSPISQAKIALYCWGSSMRRSRCGNARAKTQPTAAILNIAKQSQGDWLRATE